MCQPSPRKALPGGKESTLPLLHLGCNRFKVSPGCRVFSLTTSAVVFEGSKQAYELEGQRGTLCPGPQATHFLCLLLL